MTDAVFERQNEEDILELLYAQRVSYNRAEVLNRAGWVMTLFLLAQEVCKLFIPVIDEYSLMICAILAIIIYCVDRIRTRYIEKGARLKNLIDCILFEFPINKYDKEKLTDYSIELKSRNEEEYQEQITHDGNDTVKGVKNWYTLCNSQNHNEVILNCQKQNLWWNQELVKYYKIALILCILLLILTTIISVYITGIKVSVFVAIIICVTTILVRCCDAFKTMGVYTKAMIRAHGKLDIIEKRLDKDTLLSLQHEIDAVRMSGFLIPNWLHAMYSIKLHRKREELNNRTSE